MSHCSKQMSHLLNKRIKKEKLLNEPSWLRNNYHWKKVEELKLGGAE